MMGAARTAVLAAVALVAWQVAGSFSVSVPAPGRIALDLWAGRDLYGLHCAATARVAVIGFIVGNAAAIAAALVFCFFPLAEQIMRGVNIALFALPVIVAGPLLVLILDGDKPQIITSAITVYFPTMAATLVGLREIDPRLADLLSVYGGKALAEMRFVRLRSAVPGVLAGLRVASSMAVLGAILGEFGSGGRWWLGSFLLGSLGQGDPARLWGIALAGTAMAMAGYGLFAWLGRRAVPATIAVTIAAGLSAGGRPLSGPPWFRAMIFAASAAMPFLVWGGLIRLAGLSPIIAPGPLDTLWALAGPDAGAARSALLAALVQTVPVAALGLAFGLAAAFGLAVLAVLRPGLVRAIMPVALVLQSTPLVTLAPILLLVFGRDIGASVAMAVLVVFFPAFVLVVEGLALVPPALKDLVAGYGGSRWQELRFVSLRHASGYLAVAAKLVAPRALLGVMISEWLLTGTGLGNLLNAARGEMDYDMVWGAAMVSVILAVGAYQAVTLCERALRPDTLNR